MDLEAGLKAISTAGNQLNQQEILCLQSTLTMLRSKEKYDSIYLWGKIFGKKSDYYIAYGLTESSFEFPSKTFYYAGEDYEFKPLPRLTEEVADHVIALGMESQFTGVESTPIEAGAPTEGEGDPPADGEASGPPPLTELDRLSQVIQEIDFDTAVVPKGAYALNEAHMVVPSSDFKGLGVTEAAALSNYVHYRPPTSVACLRALARTDVQFYSNFLDPLLSDLPKGCWVCRQDPSMSLVTLRSLNWQGYVSYHTPLTSKFGGLYFGYAQKNKDLPFIL